MVINAGITMVAGAILNSAAFVGGSYLAKILWI